MPSLPLLGPPLPAASRTRPSLTTSDAPSFSKGTLRYVDSPPTSPSTLVNVPLLLISAGTVFPDWWKSPVSPSFVEGVAGSSTQRIEPLLLNVVAGVPAGVPHIPRSPPVQLNAVPIDMLPVPPRSPPERFTVAGAVVALNFAVPPETFSALKTVEPL